MQTPYTYSSDHILHLSDNRENESWNMSLKGCPSFLACGPSHFFSSRCHPPSPNIHFPPLPSKYSCRVKCLLQNVNFNSCHWKPTSSCSQSFSLKLPGKSSIRCDNLCRTNNSQSKYIILVKHL